jgi:hypothetical protein
MDEVKEMLRKGDPLNNLSHEEWSSESDSSSSDSSSHEKQMDVFRHDSGDAAIESHRMLEGHGYQHGRLALPIAAACGGFVLLLVLIIVGIIVSILYSIIQKIAL